LPSEAGPAHRGLRPGPRGLLAMKRISDRSFRDPDAYRLSQGMSLIACDRRSEGDLGRPGYVSSLWDGWMASNHVMRVIPRKGIPSGLSPRGP
jgi:hypothetical protein